MNPIAFLKPLAELGRGWLEGRQKVQLAKIEAQVTRLQQSAQHEADWDREALRQMQYSWKDEYILLLITAPIWYAMITSAFFPEHMGAVDRFFLILSEFPEWWIASFTGIVAASFGLRWMFARDRKQIAEKVVETKKTEASAKASDTPATFD